MSLLNNDLVCAVVFIVMGGAFRAMFLFFRVYDIRLEQLLTGIGAGYFCRYIRNNEKLRTAAEKHKVKYAAIRKEKKQAAAEEVTSND